MNRRSLLKSSLATIAAGSVLSNVQARPLYRLDKVIGINKVRIWEEALRIPPAQPLRARLLANENPFGPSPKARLALMESARQGNRYGFNEANQLKEMIAAKEGVPSDHICLGPGSTDLLEKTAIVKFSQGGNIITADPSYLALIKTATYFDTELRAVPLTDDHAHDLSAMEAAVDEHTKLIYVCNPNNPTGSLTSNADLRTFCEKLSGRTTVFVDEAYLEFLPEGGEGQSMVDLVRAGKNVIVARTFSKLHGMAGLRIGYIVARPEHVAKISKLARPAMGTSMVSLKAAIASLGDEEFLQMSRQKTAEARAYVARSLNSMGIPFIPSHTSFMIFPLQQDGKQYLDDMFSHGIGVRLFMIDDAPWSRVSMGTMEEMEMFVDTLKKVIV
ncbi:MAG: aminotransferase class I/II-fold pyridoxal phosphate-dependent enzyme [Saprospiraceae bacterium]|nr:aminotransferase class I/II-fold pyridoxal phosphate-dependent enzyme [Saprospiraceae bacterium]